MENLQTATGEGIRWLFSLVNHETRLPEKYTSQEYCLDRYRELLEALNNPHENQTAETVQILGTDGKGSTLAMLESFFGACQKKVCSFISPHLVDVTERFRVNGQDISCAELNDCLSVVAKAAEKIQQPTFFEACNAAFWLWVQDQRPDYVLLETGIGGRLDTTTVCRAKMKILTRLDRDHIHLLGKRVSKIAKEKLHAMRKDVSVVISQQHDLLETDIEQYLQENHIQHVWADRQVELRTHSCSTKGWAVEACWEDGQRQIIHNTLLGEHQLQNLASALVTSRHLLGEKITPQTDISIQPAWKGRCQLTGRNNNLVLDGSHTPLSGSALRHFLDSLFDQQQRVFFFICTQDRYPWCYLKWLVRPSDQIVIVDWNHPRLWNAETLKNKLHHDGWTDSGQPEIKVAPIDPNDIEEQLGKDQIGVFCGSFYWVGEVLKRLRKVD